MVPARTLTRLLVLATGLALVACNRQPAAPKPKALPAAYVQAEQAWRTERLASLTKPDGWTSLVGLHWLDPGSHYAGTAPGNGIRLAAGPDQLGMFDVRDGRVRFVPGAHADLTIDGQPAKPGTLRADDDEGGPSIINFDAGKGIATVIHRGDRYALRV